VRRRRKGRKERREYLNERKKEGRKEYSYIVKSSFQVGLRVFGITFDLTFFPFTTRRVT
jgi:hypothetical protein